MDPMFTPRRRSFVLGIAGWLAFTLPVALSNAADDPVVHSSGPVSYVSGGVGDESIGQLNALAARFNLKLVFALSSGQYLSDVRVLITDSKGQTLVDAVSEGPWFLARLPPGVYEIAASFAAKTEKRRVTLGAGGLRTVDLRWTSE